jgi:vacuolar-type H+-ATPase subunit C/Vma6
MHASSLPSLSAMVTAPGIGPLPGWRDLGPLDDGASILNAVYRRLVDDYAAMSAAYPEARDALAALVQLHEVENIKLLWRAAVRRLAHRQWRASWRPLGPLQRIEAEDFTAPFSQIELVAALARTPYARPAEASLRAHGADVAAAELAFDRFGSSRVAAARDRLPRAERSARALLRAVIARRDATVFERAVTTLGVDSASAVLMTALGQALPIKSRERAPARSRRVMIFARSRWRCAGAGS